MKSIDLPKIINGKQYYLSSEDEERVTFRYDSGIEIRMPKITAKDLELVLEEGKKIAKELQELTTSDIAIFLNKVGNLWDQSALQGRKMAETYAPLLTQYSDIVIEGDYKTIGDFMMQRFHMYDQIESEFGNERIFDEWIPTQMSYVRAFPRGLALHYLVGNLPLASIYSLLRGIMTKNRNFAKLPSRDPVTPIGFVQCFIEADPDHPITRSLSLGYWHQNDEIGTAFINASDSVCVWGGKSAVEAIKKKVPANVPFAEYGPRWSASAIDLNQCDMEKAAFRLIEDCSYYDQEACFNTQRAYVKGDLDAFLVELKKYFKVFSKNVPFLNKNIDVLANRSISLLEANYVGLNVENGDDWAIVVMDEEEANEINHPLTRTIFIHPVDDLSAISKHFNRDNQTLSVYPWSIIKDYRDEWASNGICRLVELGWSRIFRSGFTHDGMHGMHPMVRLVSIERPWSDMGRYYSLRPNLEQYWFQDKYPQYRTYIDNKKNSNNGIKIK
ncbi:acyl-CoA reductase [Aureispira anguillae]|uniref:Acyl-CoA reductase n=1 Tax=Aureispira anguillae TaxID=2864201 RepID=A0A915YEL3_9BACT|nr:acyl-CoA reductase [Aureispira anguillae]BDS11583.1 hypothetical protein AsAng_0022970 [Aureispira anguillae]